MVGIKTIKEDKTAHIIEMEVRWKGDSKVILAIDTYGPGLVLLFCMLCNSYKI